MISVNFVVPLYMMLKSLLLILFKLDLYSIIYIGVYSTTAKYQEESIHKELTLSYVILLFLLMISSENFAVPSFTPLIYILLYIYIYSLHSLFLSLRFFHLIDSLRYFVKSLHWLLSHIDTYLRNNICTLMLHW